MLTPTHLVTAQTAYFGACIATGQAPSPSESLVALAAAMLPDLDSRQSYSGRLVPALSTWIGHRYGHRTLTHALLPQVLVLTAAWFALPTGFFIAVAAGWLSHSLADMMTRSGVCWFWPSLARCVLPGNPRYRMEVMGIGELWFLGLMAALGLVLMPLAQRAEGTTGLIRSAIGDIAAARTDYDADKGSVTWTLTLRGRHNLTHADVSGRYAVIGPWREDGFLIATPDGPRSTCRNTTCDWYASHADLTRGIPQLTTSYPLTADVIPAATLAASIAHLRTDAVYLVGSFTAPESSALPPTVEVAGDRVTLLYATPDRLAAWQGRTLTGVELVVQARHAPGVDPGAPGDLGQRQLELDPRLQRWLQ